MENNGVKFLRYAGYIGVACLFVIILDSNFFKGSPSFIAIVLSLAILGIPSLIISIIYKIFKKKKWYFKEIFEKVLTFIHIFVIIVS